MTYESRSPEAAIIASAHIPAPKQTAEEQEEQKLIRRLQMMMNMVMQVIAQDPSLSVDDASQMIADSKKAALAMFPGKELAYELIWKPRFQRVMRERFRIM
jgi:RNase H-fold protein (predicted Holliday junction resolvase)